MRQKTFNTYSSLSPASIIKVYDAAGLGGIHPEKDAMALIRYKLKKALKGLQEKGIVKRFNIKNDKLEIHNSDLFSTVDF